MDESVRVLGTDSEGYEIITEAVKSLLREYDPKITYNSSPVSFISDAGALILTETETISGDITRECQYPCFIVYRLTANDERTRLAATEYLERLGRYLSRLKTFPALTDNRKIRKITCLNAYQGTIAGESHFQTWLMPVSILYTHEEEGGF